MRTFAIISLLSVAFLLKANNESPYQPGMRWETERYSTSMPDPPTMIEKGCVEENVIIDDVAALKLNWTYEGSDSKGSIFLRVVEEEKIYFQLTEGNDENRYLLYDFSLSPGEGCYVYNPRLTGRDENPYMSYVKCETIRENDPDYYGWDTLYLKEYESEDCEIYDGNLVWLKGLASSGGILDNNGTGFDGIGSGLMEVMLNGDIIYKARQASIEKINETGSDTIYSIKTEGLQVTVEGLNKDDAPTVYSLGGSVFSPYVINDGIARLKVPETGIYILKVGDFIRKFSIK